MPFNYLLTHFFPGIKAETYLVVVKLKTVILKQFFIIWLIIIEAINRWLKSFYQQTPPAISFTKVDGTIHSLHSPLDKPVFCCIKKQVRRLLIINRIKKTNTTYRYVITLIAVFFIRKSSNTANQF